MTMTKRMLAALAGAVLMAVPAGAAAQYGSIVFSPNIGAGYGWGFSWGYGSRHDARDRAVRECRNKGGEGCAEVGWFSEECGALAVSPEGGYGSTKGAAESKALSACRSAGNSSCRVPASRCHSSGGSPGSAGLMVELPQYAKLPCEQTGTPESRDWYRALIKAWQSMKGYAPTGVFADEQAWLEFVAEIHLPGATFPDTATLRSRGDACEDGSMFATVAD